MKANILLEGPTGVGKTFVSRTLLPHFRRVVVMTHEQGFWNTVRSKPISETLLKRIKFKLLPPAKLDWKTLLSNAKTLNTGTNESLQKMPGLNRQDYQQFIQMISLLADFKTDDGEKLGAADDWGEDTCLFQDGLTGLSRMSMENCIGAKPIRTQPDWGVAMDNLENFLRMMTTGLNCSYVLISHLEREPNELTGVPTLGVSTLGRKLAPKIPPMFDEVIRAKRDGQNFVWSTMEANEDLKTRMLPISSSLTPDFGLIFKEVIPDASPEVHQEGAEQA